MKKVLLGDPIVAASYLGFAKKLLAHAKRLGAKYPLSRSFVDGTKIEVQAAPWGDSILIFGGLSFLPLILLVNQEKGYGFNYKSGKIGQAKITPSGENLISLFNGRCQFGDATYSTYKGGWATGRINNSNYAHIASLPKYELAVFRANDTLYGRVGNDLGSLQQLSFQNYLDHLSGAYGPLVGVVGYDRSPWNQFDAAWMVAFNPLTKTLYDQWHWLPSFFNAWPQDPNYLTNGHYYGDYPTSRYGEESYAKGALSPYALDYAEVKLLATLDCKNYTVNGVEDEYLFGWAEIVKRVDYGPDITKYPNDIYFYFSMSPLSPNTDNYNDNFITLFPGVQYVTVGTKLFGFNPSLILRGVGYSNPDVDMWAFSSWENPDAVAPQTNAVGIVLASDQVAKVYRFKGYNSLVYSTENYHSHSISPDGKKIAIFEGGSVISEVVVFDLFGETNEAGEYTRGGYQKISVENNLVDLGMTEGVITPYRSDDLPYSALPYVLADQTAQNWGLEDISEKIGAFGTIHYVTDGKQPLSISKVTVTEGVNAVFSTSTDRCFTSTVVVDDPRDVEGIDEDELVGWWDNGAVEIVRGVVRGSFTGDPGSMKFEGKGRGDIGRFTGDLNIPINKTTSGGYLIQESNVLGNLILGNGFEADGTLNLNLGIPSCDPPGVTITATSDCGGYGEEFFPSGDLELTGPDYVDPDTDIPWEDDIFTVSGGTPPYTWSFDKGSIQKYDSDYRFYVTSVVACAPGEVIRTGTVSVTDSCGEEMSLIVRLPGGGWVQDPPTGPYWAATTCTAFDVFAQRINIISGSTRFEIVIGNTTNPFTVCDGCTDNNFMGFSCAEDITGPSYFGKYWKGTNDPFVFSVIAPKRAYRYNWECQ